MPSDLVNLSLGFIEGLALILSPCILPILPLILAGSLSGSKKRPLGIIVGFALIFSLFTLFSRFLVEVSGLDLNLVRDFSYALLMLLGLVMLSPALSEKFTHMTRNFANLGSRLRFANNPDAGFFSGFCFGGLVALIWTPCAGPILAAVIVQTVLQKTTVLSFLITLAFAVGAALPMLVIVLLGRQIMAKTAFLKAHSSLIRRALGAIICVSVLYMVMTDSSLASIRESSSPSTASSQGLENALANPQPAPPLVGLSNWINSPPLTLNQLRGKVVLIDFWTYSCINCQRTLPYLKDWYQKYHDQGLVIIGIHTPEFDFEKNPDNVKEAVLKDGILYPVALDNQFGTWQSFQNRYWPAHYLIDKDGKVVYVHFGEGDYDATENNIRYLLGMGKTSSELAPTPAFSNEDLSPETYLGSSRANSFASPEPVQLNQLKSYSYPAALEAHHFALKGPWIIAPDRVIAEGSNSYAEIHFKASKVYIVMGTATGKPIQVQLKLNGQELNPALEHQIKNSQIEVKWNTLYQALDLSEFTDGTLEVHPLEPGLEIYTFTFGS